jgi:phosphatidylinositol alpha-1,6-mannosyltransferase
MRILLVTHYYSTHAGGIEIVAGSLAERLAATHRVVWAASDCDSPPGVGGRLRLLPMRSLNVIERLTGLPFPLWGVGSLVRLWRESADADVIHLHDIAYVGNWMAFVYAWLRRKPVLVTQHVGFIPYRSAILRVALRLLHRTVGRWMLGRASQVVFISPAVRGYFGEFVTFRRRPELVWNGVDTDTYVRATGGDRERERTALGLDPARPVLLFVGRFVEKKGLRVLEALARRMEDVTWAFAGWGPIDPDAWNAPNVRVFRDRRGPGLVPLYHAADLLVLPSVGEGLPLVIQEAMSCGIPVLTGEDTACAVDAPPGIVFACAVGGAETVDAWATALRRIVADLHTQTDIPRAVAEFARSRWSWRAAADTYSELFDRLLRQGRD